MADRGSPRKPIDGRGAGEMIAHQPLAALGVEPRAVVGDDAGGFLAAMLERMQPKRDNRRGVGVVENAKDAALLPQPVFGDVDASSVSRAFGECGRRCVRGVEGRVLNLAHHCFGAGANGAGAGTFLLISASSFCLSRAEPLDPAVESDFFGAAGAGITGGRAPDALGFEAAESSTGSSLVIALARDL